MPDNEASDTPENEEASPKIDIPGNIESVFTAIGSDIEIHGDDNITVNQPAPDLRARTEKPIFIDALDKQSFGALDEPDNPGAPNSAAAASLRVSLRLLNEAQRDQFARLAIFPEDVDVALVTLEKLWNVKHLPVLQLFKRLNDLSLVLAAVIVLTNQV